MEMVLQSGYDGALGSSGLPAALLAYVKGV